MFDFYNVKYYWKSFTSTGIASPLARITNAFTDAMNGNSHLPKLILFLLDVDLLKSITYYKFGVSMVIGKVLGHLINSIITMTNEQKAKLKAVRTGAITPGEPKFLWMGIIDRPKADRVLSLRRKHNEIMEETLTLHDNCFYINLNQALSRYDFDRNNNITTEGKINFWHFIDEGVKQFEVDNRIFAPQKVVTNMN